MFDIIILTVPSVTDGLGPLHNGQSNGGFDFNCGSYGGDPSGRREKLCCWCGFSTNSGPSTEKPANGGQSIILLVASISVQSREAGVCTSK